MRERHEVGEALEGHGRERVGFWARQTAMFEQQRGFRSGERGIGHEPQRR
jgi:hypothetical protein